MSLVVVIGLAETGAAVSRRLRAEGDDVVIVEDVVTTGGSSLAAIERVKAFGLNVVRVVAIIDRMEGGAQAFAERGYPLSSLLTIRDFGIEPPRN